MKIQVMKTTLLEALAPLAKISTPTKNLAITSKAKTVTLSVIGEKEQSEGTMAVRSRREDQLGAMNLETFIEKLQSELENKL